MNAIRSLLETIHFYWHWPTFSVLLLMAALMGAIYSRERMEFVREEPVGGVPVEATITSMSSNRTKYLGKPPGVTVAARTIEGIRGSVLVLPREILGCKVGDRIEAVQDGLRLYLTPRPCD